MKFPNNHYSSAEAYFEDYISEVTSAYMTVDRKILSVVSDVVKSAIDRDAVIFCCGNGGSAAIANHLVCDHQKGINADTSLCPRVISLSSNVEVLTASANDHGYENVFSHTLNIHGRKGDLLIAVSSSGDSENIVRAISSASNIGMKTIAMTGFEGGRSRYISDFSLHVQSHNYGVVEDVHQSLMHVIAQYVRHEAMPLDMVKNRSF